jgi:hypothetical protein
MYYIVALSNESMIVHLLIQMMDISQLSMDNSVIDYFIPTLMNKYRYKYCCASIDHDIWYKFKNHKWNKIDSMSIRKLILDKFIIECDKQQAHLCKMISQCHDFESKAQYYYAANKICDMIMRFDNNILFKNVIVQKFAEVAYDPNFLKVLDEKSYLICFKNGVYDLNTNEFGNGRPDDYISLCTGYDYMDFNKNDKNYREIKNFFKKIQPDKSMREYLLTVLSTCLSDLIPEENLYIFTGSKTKNKIMELMKYTLGDLFEPIKIINFSNDRINILERINHSHVTHSGIGMPSYIFNSGLTDDNTLITCAEKNTTNKKISFIFDINNKKGIRMCIFDDPHNNNLSSSSFARKKIDDTISEFIKKITRNDFVTRTSPKELIYFKPQFKSFLLYDRLPNITLLNNAWKKFKVISFPNENMNSLIKTKNTSSSVFFEKKTLVASQLKTQSPSESINSLINTKSTKIQSPSENINSLIITKSTKTQSPSESVNSLIKTKSTKTQSLKVYPETISSDKKNETFSSDKKKNEIFSPDKKKNETFSSDKKIAQEKNILLLPIKRHSSKLSNTENNKSIALKTVNEFPPKIELSDNSAKSKNKINITQNNTFLPSIPTPYLTRKNAKLFQSDENRLCFSLPIKLDNQCLVEEYDTLENSKPYSVSCENIKSNKSIKQSNNSELMPFAPKNAGNDPKIAGNEHKNAGNEHRGSTVTAEFSTQSRASASNNIGGQSRSDSRLNSPRSGHKADRRVIGKTKSNDDFKKNLAVLKQSSKISNEKQDHANNILIKKKNITPSIVSTLSSNPTLIPYEPSQRSSFTMGTGTERKAETTTKQGSKLLNESQPRVNDNSIEKLYNYRRIFMAILIKYYNKYKIHGLIVPESVRQQTFEYCMSQQKT